MGNGLRVKLRQRNGGVGGGRAKLDEKIDR